MEVSEDCFCTAPISKNKKKRECSGGRRLIIIFYDKLLNGFHHFICLTKACLYWNFLKTLESDNIAYRESHQFFSTFPIWCRIKISLWFFFYFLILWNVWGQTQWSGRTSQTMRSNRQIKKVQLAYRFRLIESFRE